VLTLNNPLALGGNNPGVNGTSAIHMTNGATLRTNQTNAATTIYAPITTSGNVTVNGPTVDNGTQAVNEFVINGGIGGTRNVTFNNTSNNNQIFTATLTGTPSTYTSTTTVSGTGTLKGSGSVNSSVTVSSGGTLASGTSIESLAVGGDLSFTTGSIFEYEMDKDALPNVAGDLTAVTGSLSLAGTVTLNLIETGIGSWELGNPIGDHFGSPTADKLTLISYNGTWNSGLFTYLGNLVQDDSGILINGQQWWFNYNDIDAGTNFTGDLGAATRFVTITVPEPAAALFGAIGTIILLRRRRLG
jgi:hypothetical protein